MAVLEILTYPDARLKQTSNVVELFDDALHAFIVDLESTMRAGPGGVGIAAPQVGRFERIVIVDVSSKVNNKTSRKTSSQRSVTSQGCMILINPEITHSEGRVVGREGCMSVPDFTGNVIRADTIYVQADDENGIQQQYKSSGYEARAIQHEIDHLDGLLFLDRLVSTKNDLFRRKLVQK